MKPFWKKQQKKKTKPKTKLVAKPSPKPPRPRPEPEIVPDYPKPLPKKAVPKIDPRKEFLRTFEKLSSRHNAWEVWSDFVTMLACAISNSVDKEHFQPREELYLKLIKKYKKDGQKLFPELAAYTVEALDENQEQDFLGSIFMELNLGNHHNGQFFTPYHVSQLMADITEGDILSQVNEKGYVTIHDPCCGAGAMLIAGINTARRQLEKAGLNFQNHILIVGQDIDFTVAMMCYIQVSLLGVAGYFKVGNSLTEPMAVGDSTENYWFTPMYFSPVWTYRRLFQEVDALMNSDAIKNIIDKEDRHESETHTAP